MAAKKDEVKEAVEAIYSGKLAKDIRANSSYALTGMGVGAILGIILASFMGKSRLVFALGGAAICGAAGYVTSKTQNKDI